MSRYRPNRVMSEPATPQACAADLRTKRESTTAAGAARDQLAFTRMAASGEITAPDDAATRAEPTDS